MSRVEQEAESHVPSETPVGPRRRFFQWMIGIASGLIGLGLAIPLAGYVVSPALKRREQRWVDVGSAEELPVGAPRQLEHVTTIRDGWLETQSHKAVWAVKQAEDHVVVYSPICTHLGCGYRWEQSERLFKCPCHGSVFDVKGAVVAGPAPRPLDILPSKIEAGRLWVQYKEFKSGLPRPVEL